MHLDGKRHQLGEFLGRKKALSWRCLRAPPGLRGFEQINTVVLVRYLAQLCGVSAHEFATVSVLSVCFVRPGRAQTTCRWGRDTRVCAIRRYCPIGWILKRSWARQKGACNKQCGPWRGFRRFAQQTPWTGDRCVRVFGSTGEVRSALATSSMRKRLLTKAQMFGRCPIRCQG